VWTLDTKQHQLFLLLVKALEEETWLIANPGGRPPDGFLFAHQPFRAIISGRPGTGKTQSSLAFQCAFGSSPVLGCHRPLVVTIACIALA
jgi:hypothetical protein